jgi:pyrroline-5-carboxylate reductase
MVHTAIIGLGNIGTTVARNLVAGGRKVTLAARAAAKAESLGVAVDGVLAVANGCSKQRDTERQLLAMPAAKPPFRCRPLSAVCRAPQPDIRCLPRTGRSQLVTAMTASPSDPDILVG